MSSILGSDSPVCGSYDSPILGNYPVPIWYNPDDNANILSLHNMSQPDHVTCDTQTSDEACQEFRGQVVPQIEAVHNLRKVRMYLNVLSLRSTS